MKLLGNTKTKTTTDKNGENVPQLEIPEEVLVHCNIVHNNYQQKSRDSYTFISNKLFDQLLDFLPKYFIFSKHLNWNFHILMYGLLIKLSKFLNR